MPARPCRPAPPLAAQSRPLAARGGVGGTLTPFLGLGVGLGLGVWLSLALGLALGFASALAAPRVPRIAAYTVINGVEIPAPLGGLTGDAGRGAALFADPAMGGCIACHAMGSRPATGVAPEVVLAALAPPAPDERARAELENAPGSQSEPTSGLEPESEPESEPEPELAARSSPDSASGAAPLRAPLPMPRGAVGVEVAAEMDAETDAETDAAPDAAPDSGTDGAGAAIAAANDAAQGGPSLPLAQGPALDDAAARLGAGGLRLWIVDPVLAGGVGMPGYHAIDFAAALRAPDLRQPWLAAQQIEDIVAYLLDPSAQADPRATPTAPAGAPR